MKNLFGVFAVLALITGGVVLSDEVASIVEQEVALPDANQAVESAVEDSVTPQLQEALPEDTDVPAATPPKAAEQVVEQAVEQATEQTAEQAVEQALSDTPQPVQTIVNSPFILGVETTPVPPMVRAQINLPGHSGLFVQRIKPNGPAAKAGVLPYDIIVSIDGVAVGNIQILSTEVQKAAGKPQKLTVLRHGKQLTLDITAQPSDTPYQPQGFFFGNSVMPMPQPYVDPLDPNYDPNEDDDCSDPAFPRLHQFMERQRHQMEIMRQRMEAIENAMRQGMPGFMPFAPGAAPTPAPAPNGVLTLPSGAMNDPNAQVQRDSFSVQVQKNGNEPAIIKIQENGNEYIVDENSIDQLPENVRNRLNFKIQTNDN